MPFHQPLDGSGLPLTTTMVAVDKDKNSGHAFHWAINHLDNPIVIAVHVKNKNIPHHGSNVFPPDEEDAANVFSSLRGMLVPRKAVKMKEAVLDDSDVVKGILDYAQRNHIHSIVLGAPTKNALAKSLKITAGSKKFKGLQNVPAAVIKSAPDFSSVYVISKGKIVAARPAVRPLANMAVPPKVQALPHNESENGVRAKTPEINSYERSNNAVRARERPKSAGSVQSMDNIGLSNRGQRTSLSVDFMSDESDLSWPLNFGSMDMTNQDLDLSFTSSSEASGTSSDSQNSRDMETEMKLLRQKLKQTMDMYSSACKEAISAQNKAKEIHQWKLEEARKVEEVRLSEEAALAMAEKEKARAQAAIEAAEQAKKMAEIEAQRRMLAEMMAKKEAEEKDQALTALAQNDNRYRKYTIEDIEIATEKFSPSLKIGEGGYGPVYRGELDHTPVAIKILSPDASQGRKQFQQEVEVLSCIRHPNMVLLLGACPEHGCLVYEYMENGSLEDRLFRKNNSPPISWRKRFEIAAEIATALLFLHQTKPEPLVHRDLKPANILLDRNFVSKISDVGLARLVPPSVADSVTQYYVTSAAGTFCYIDPEYQQTGILTPKSDVYSLGIMLLQIITAKPAMGLAHHVRRAIEKEKLSEMLDPVVPDWPVEEALSFAKLALGCAELSKKDRPDLGSVIVPELNRLREFACASLRNDEAIFCSNNNQTRGHVARPPTPSQGPHSKTKNGAPQEPIFKDSVEESTSIPRKEYCRS